MGGSFGFVPLVEADEAKTTLKAHISNTISKGSLESCMLYCQYQHPNCEMVVFEGSNCHIGRISDRSNPFTPSFQTPEPYDVYVHQDHLLDIEDNFFGERENIDNEESL